MSKIYDNGDLLTTLRQVVVMMMILIMTTITITIIIICIIVLCSVCSEQTEHHKMSTADDKLRLQWNDFKENISSAFGDLRQDKELTDVTLVSEDGQQVEAHKVVLVASSPFFLNILKKNKHPHPLIYIRGVRPENLMTMVDFFYHGEAKVYQENLDSFLVLAEELQLNGLKGNQTEKERGAISQQKSPNYRSVTDQFAAEKDVFNDDGLEQVSEQISEKAHTLKDEAAVNTDLESLDEQVKSMMTVSENADPYRKRNGRARICTVCGKEGSTVNIMQHIKANHIAGISIPCDRCGLVSRSRNALQVHEYNHHNNK